MKCQLNKFIIGAAVIVLLAACQSTEKSSFKPKDINLEYLYADAEFEGYQRIAIESEQDVFALDDDMRAMVRQKLKIQRSVRERAIRLLEHIFESENINLQYQGGANLTARETYHSAMANCMSLTIMAYALAKEAGLEVDFQDIDVPEYWQRNGQYNMLTGHVNLVVKRKVDQPINSIIFNDTLLEIDFDPFVAKKTFTKRVISKKTMLAMFYNNKGAKALAEKDNDVAYAYFRAATKTDALFSSSWGNLAILYKRAGHTEHAKAAYLTAIKLDNNNNTAKDNYAMLLRKEGKYAEAEAIELEVLKTRVRNPYYYALLGNEALHRNALPSAMRHYKKAIQLDSKIDEFYIGLANVYYQMDNLGAARIAMRRAIAINKRPAIENQYIAKLNFLKQAKL